MLTIPQIKNLFKQLRKITPYKVGNSIVVTLFKRYEKSWLNAVEFEGGWFTWDELQKLSNFIGSKKVFVVIPIFEDEYGVKKK